MQIGKVQVIIYKRECKSFNLHIQIEFPKIYFDIPKAEEEAQRLTTAAYIAARVRKARESVLPIPQLFSRRVTSVVEALTMHRFRTLN